MRTEKNCTCLSILGVRMMGTLKSSVSMESGVSESVPSVRDSEGATRDSTAAGVVEASGGSMESRGSAEVGAADGSDSAVVAPSRMVSSPRDETGGPAHPPAGRAAEARTPHRTISQRRMRMGFSERDYSKLSGELKARGRAKGWYRLSVKRLISRSLWSFGHLDTFSTLW